MQGPFVETEMQRMPRIFPEELRGSVRPDIVIPRRAVKRNTAKRIQQMFKRYPLALRGRVVFPLDGIANPNHKCRLRRRKLTPYGLIDARYALAGQVPTIAKRSGP